MSGFVSFFIRGVSRNNQLDSEYDTDYNLIQNPDHMDLQATFTRGMSLAKQLISAEVWRTVQY